MNVQSREPPAPHGLDLVIDFVNTLDIEEATEALKTPADLRAWLSSRELAPEDGEIVVSQDDLREAIGLRESLRAVMLSHNGGLSDPQAAQELERVARRGELGVSFGADGSSLLTPGAAGFAGALARLLVPVVEADRDASWERVKACRADDCNWAFYDRSRNRSGVWCDMAVCGNRSKVRAYRKRAPRTGSSGAPSV